MAQVAAVPECMLRLHALPPARGDARHVVAANF